MSEQPQQRPAQQREEPADEDVRDLEATEEQAADVKGGGGGVPGSPRQEN